MSSSPTTNNTTPVGRLHVRVVEARNVANPKLVGMPETFVTLSMDGQQIQYTSIINSNTPNGIKFSILMLLTSTMLNFALTSARKQETLWNISAYTLSGWRGGRRERSRTVGCHYSTPRPKQNFEFASARRTLVRRGQQSAMGFRSPAASLGCSLANVTYKTQKHF